MLKAALAIVVAAFVASAWSHDAAPAATFYVSGQGNDQARGRSPEHPWRTVARVNRAKLAPGDRVVFQGGMTYSDGVLVPRVSGTRSDPIVYSSYGKGRAVLTQGVWLHDVSHLVLRNLILDAVAEPPFYTGQAILASNGGNGSPYITITRCIIQRWRLGINLSNVGDKHWNITNNIIRDIGESGILIEDDRQENGEGAPGVRIEGNVISETGRARMPYGVHGIYTRGPHTIIRNNRIDHFRDSAITFRFNDTLIERNRIRDGREGITWYPYGEAAGTSTIAYNVVEDFTEVGLFIAGVQHDIQVPRETRENFLVVNNTFIAAGGAVGVDAQPEAARMFTFANNIVAGGNAVAYVLDRRPGSYVEKNNLWYARGQPLRWRYLGKTYDSLARLREVSGQTAGDRVGNPELSGDLIPARGSPAVDGAATDVAPYARTCTGKAFSYCGAAPDIGAVERPG